MSLLWVFHAFPFPTPGARGWIIEKTGFDSSLARCVADPQGTNSTKAGVSCGTVERGSSTSHSYQGYSWTHIPDGSLLWDKSFPGETLHTYLHTYLCTPDGEPLTDQSIQITIVSLSHELLTGVCPREGSIQCLLLLEFNLLIENI